MSWSGSLGVYRWFRAEAIINQHIFKVIPTGYPAWLVFDRLDAVMPVFRSVAQDKATTMGHIQRGHLESTTVDVPSATSIARLAEALDPLWERLLLAERENRSCRRSGRPSPRAALWPPPCACGGGVVIEWAKKFIAQTDTKDQSHVGHGVASITDELSTAAAETAVARQGQAVEKIFDRVIRSWCSEIELHKWNRSTRHREAASQLHPWVWSDPRSRWQSGRYRSVDDVAKKLNAQTQNKVDRRDVCETDLFKQPFGLNAAVVGHIRFRLRTPDGSDTYKSARRGAMALADGNYTGIRNPFNHEDPKDNDEQIGLEYLAVLSVLARWVDDAEVETSP